MKIADLYKPPRYPSTVTVPLARSDCTMLILLVIAAICGVTLGNPCKLVKSFGDFLFLNIDSTSPGQSGHQRIVGGHEAKPGQFPYHVTVWVKGDRVPSCGASILSERYVVTAAHCLDDGADQMFLQVGKIERSDPVADYYIEKTIKHPDYWSDVNTARNDIGLMKTTEKIVFNALVKPIAIRESPVKVGDNALVCGFGRVGSESASSKKLLYVSLNVISNKQCAKSQWGSVIRPVHMCTLQKVGVGICSGDSGGAVVVDNQLAGVVSFGEACAKGVPDVNTRVDQFLGWLKENMQ